MTLLCAGDSGTSTSEADPAVHVEWREVCAHERLQHPWACLCYGEPKWDRGREGKRERCSFLLLTRNHWWDSQILLWFMTIWLGSDELSVNNYLLLFKIPPRNYCRFTLLCKLVPNEVIFVILCWPQARDGNSVCVALSGQEGKYVIINIQEGNVRRSSVDQWMQ